MTESNNVKFVEAQGKWMWKRYDENGSVVYRSPEFDTEKQARDDYEINGSESLNQTAPEHVSEAGTAAPENENSAGQAAPRSEDQGAGLL